MSFETAVLVLAWIAITVLAFAMAGMLSMIRRLQSELQGSLTAGADFGDNRAQAAASFAPTTRPYAFVLTVSADCAACAEVLPRFHQFAERHDEVDFHVLSAYEETALRAAGLPVTIDPGAFAALSPGYTPGMVVIDRTGSVVDVGPGGDLDSVARWIERQHLSHFTEEPS